MSRRQGASAAGKERIVDAFSGAVDSYDDAAGVQALVAERLAEAILAEAPRPGGQVLEIGCGTGFLTRRLMDSLPGRRWLVTDIAPAMVERCRAGLAPSEADFRVMDGEWPDLPPESLDGIASSLAFQWFGDLPGAIPRLAALLRPGGRMWFGTLAADTFTEWRALHAAMGLPCGARPFPPADRLRRLAPVLREERIAVAYPDGLSFLRALRAIGADTPVPDHAPLPAGAMRRLQRRFDGRVTYHVVYGCLRR